MWLSVFFVDRPHIQCYTIRVKGVNALNERIKKLRKSLDFTQQEFAEKIGTARNNIAGYETGKRSPSEAVISLICKTFNVSEEWLRTGDGEMFAPKTESAMEALVQERGLSDADRLLVEKFLNLKPAERQVVMKYVLSVAAEYTQPAALLAIQTDEDIEAEVEEYRRRLILEKNQAEESSLLSGVEGTTA